MTSTADKLYPTTAKTEAPNPDGWVRAPGGGWVRPVIWPPIKAPPPPRLCDRMFDKSEKD